MDGMVVGSMVGRAVDVHGGNAKTMPPTVVGGMAQ